MGQSGTNRDEGEINRDGGAGAMKFAEWKWNFGELWAFLEYRGEGSACQREAANKCRTGKGWPKSVRPASGDMSAGNGGLGPCPVEEECRFAW